MLSTHRAFEVSVMDIAPIKSQRDYRRVLGEIEGLMNARRNTAEGDRLDVLVTLVEAWERKHYPLDLPDPVEAIKYHMEQSGLQPRGNFRQRMFPDLVVDLLVAQVEFDAQAGAPCRSRDNFRVFVAFRGDGGDDGLDRREPKREVARIVFDQDADKALHRTADRAVHHDRHFL